MSCCGKKRKDWLSKALSPVNRASANSIAPGGIVNADRLFQYTGDSSLTVKGVFTANTYVFQFKGDSIKIPYNDSFALMAEADLKIVG